MCNDYPDCPVCDTDLYVDSSGVGQAVYVCRYCETAADVNGRFVV